MLLVTFVTTISNECHAEKFRNTKKKRFFCIDREWRKQRIVVLLVKSLVARIRSAYASRLCGQEDIEEGRSAGRPTGEWYAISAAIPSSRCSLSHRRLATEQRGAADRSAERRLVDRVESDAAIVGRERSNGEILPGGMRCFPFVSPEGYWKGDTKSRSSPLWRYARNQHHSCILYNLAWLGLQYQLHLQRGVYARAHVRASRNVLVSSRNIVHIIVLPFPSRDL